MVMGKIIKILKLSAVFAFVIIFCIAYIYLPADGKIYAQSGKIKVYIDAGHGGSDPGAIGFGLNEKDANLDIALRLKSKLEANGFIVVMTRTNDSYSTLDERVNKANSSGADIFLSIHNNAALSQYAHGTETYWCSNGVSGSNQFANLVQNNLVSQIGRANRGVKTANFRVIKYTQMVAALVECAFVSNPTESDLLKTADFREKCSVGLFNAIVAFSKGIDKSTGNYSNSSSNNSSGFTVKIDKPENNFIASQDFTISGWAADLKNSPPIKLVKVEFYKGSERNNNNLLGSVTSFKDNILGATGIINGGWENTIEISKLDEGENIIYVYAYDKDNNYSTANVKINAIKNGDTGNDINLNPIASPGGPYTGITGKEITFDGSGSSDPDGSIVEYIWDFGDGSTGSEIKPVHTYAKAGQYTVTLKVKDDKSALSAEVTTTAIIEDETAEQQGNEDEDNVASQFETVSNSTSIIGYIDLTVDDLVRIFENRNSTKVEWARRIAPLYIEYGKLFNIRADIAWAMMCHETGFLEFTGDVKLDQNNFCGMGATGGGVPGDSFATEELGIIAHYAHLAWYYYPTHINEYCNKQYDPRHFGDSHSRYTGDTTLGFLNGRWAPGSNYTDKIILFANEVIQGINKTITPPAKTVTAEAGDDKVACVGDKLTFDASASTVSPISEGTVISYSWDWDGDGTYDETAGEAVITHTYDKAGTYEVTLKVTAFENVSATDTLTVTINDINEDPIANPGGPYTAAVGEEITFDGSGSSDSDGEIIEYMWDFGDESIGSEVSPVHSYAEVGEYVVTLAVKDDSDALSAAVSTTVTVDEEAVVEEEGTQEDQQNSEEENGDEKDTGIVQTVTAEAGEDQSGNVGDLLTFDASASTVSPLSDGTVITYSWDWDGDGTYDETVNEAVISHTYDKAGTYEISLKVTAFDNISATDTLTVTINNINQVPTASPGGPYTGEAGKELTLDGSGSSDPDGSIVEYIWDFGDSSTGSGAKPVHTYAKAGEYTVTLTVKDDKDALSVAVTTKVTVKEAEKTYPVNTSIITNSTSVVGYTEVTVDQLVKIFVNRNSTKVEWARRIAPLYIKYGKLFNIRADIAWAMMCHETGFLEFTGDVKPDQNNFVGMGATGGGVPGNSFATEELGVIAHYAHLAWYYYPDHVNIYCSIVYDPRHFGSTHYKYTGDTTLGFLNGRWAPGATYTDKIILFANQIYGF
jgi:N-acetylmuramoyl-L-alanine amidase/PKD repeat protein